jgi:hypothetical protein
MRQISSYLFLLLVCIFLSSGCKKSSVTIIPITLTNKSGSIFIQVDTTSRSFDAYTSIKLTQGQLKGIFNDTIKASFYLAITTTPYWDTIYHPSDTTIFPYHFAHTLVVQTNVDLTNYTSPYHFLLLGLPPKGLQVGSSGKLTVLLTVTPSQN